MHTVFGDFAIVYAQESFFTLMLLLGLIVIMRTNRGEHIVGAKFIWLTVGTVFLITLLNAAESTVSMHGNPIWVRTAKTVLEYTLFSVVMLSELMLIRPTARTWPLVVPLAVNVLCVSMTFFGLPLVFSYDADGDFIGGPAHFIPYACAGFYLLLLARFTVRRADKNNSSKTFIITFIMIQTAAGCVLEYTGTASRLLDKIAAFDILMYYYYLSAVELKETSRKLHRREIELEQSKSELLKTNVTLLQAQIQPHFIFNSLMAIQAQCLTAPDKVYESIENFSSYLRANLDAMTDTRLIPFRQELDHIESYLELERMNYGDRLCVELDLAVTNFILPALTVQPLVENAVRHGIGPHETGGTIRIQTSEDKQYIYIRIMDDGSGFDSSTDQQQQRRGIGLQNVQQRLRYLNIGSVQIVTTENGTCATIQIDRSYSEEEEL